MRAELRSNRTQAGLSRKLCAARFINVVRNEEVDETIALLKRALTMSRSNQRVLFMLAAYMRKENLADARQLLEHWPATVQIRNCGNRPSRC